MSTTSMLASGGPYLLAFSFVVLTGLVIATLFILTRQPIHPAIRNLLIALVAIEVLLFGLHTTTSADADITGFWDWFFDLDKESTLGNMFSAVQMALVGMDAQINGIGKQRYGRWPRLYWGLLAAGFMFLGFDEYFMIHEYLFERWGLPGELWRYLYLGAGGMLALMSGYVYRRWMKPESRLFILFFVGLVVTALSGIALEPLIWNASWPEGFCCFDPLLAIVSPGQMVGATIVLARLLLVAQRHLDPATWRAAYRLSIGASMALGLALVFNLWGAPALEARTLAERTSISYLDGDLELVGYRLSETVFEPGDTLEVTLYWYTRSSLPENYNQSVRLLARPEGEQVAEFDLGALDGTLVPSRAWLPGTVARSSLRFDLRYAAGDAELLGGSPAVVWRLAGFPRAGYFRDGQPAADARSGGDFKRRRGGSRPEYAAGDRDRVRIRRWPPAGWLQPARPDR